MAHKKLTLLALAGTLLLCGVFYACGGSVGQGVGGGNDSSLTESTIVGTTS